MANFPEIMIIRYYESGVTDVSYSNNGSEKNKEIISNRLEKEQEEDKHLETYQIYFKGQDIGNPIRSEEEREKSEIEWKKNNI